MHPNTLNTGKNVNTINRGKIRRYNQIIVQIKTPEISGSFSTLPYTPSILTCDHVV